MREYGAMKHMGRDGRVIIEGAGKGRLREKDSVGGRPQPVHGDEGGHEEQDGDGKEAHARREPLDALRAGTAARG